MIESADWEVEAVTPKQALELFLSEEDPEFWLEEYGDGIGYMVLDENYEEIDPEIWTDED